VLMSLKNIVKIFNSSRKK